MMIIVPFSQKRKVVSTKSVGEISKGDKGRVSLVVYYDVGRENGKNIITSADAGTVEYDIPDNYNVYVDSISCTISKDKKRASAKATGIIERVIKIKDRFKVQQKKLNMSGSVAVQHTYQVEFYIEEYEQLPQTSRTPNGVRSNVNYSLKVWKV